MTLCLVTDRRRPHAPDVVALARDAVAAGVDLIQIRERDQETAPLVALVTDVVALAHGSKTRVLVNDRLDVALACGAHGVHLRADSIRPREARRMAPEPFLIGRSVHSVDEVRASQGADYLIAGSVFPTRSKPDATGWLGLDGLSLIVRAATVPVLAIGGVTLERFPAIAESGATGVAAVDLFTGSSSIAAIVSAARAVFHQSFTSLRPGV